MIWHVTHDKFFMNKNRSIELTEGTPIYLITPEKFKKLPNETILYCIDGTKAIKGKDYIDDDTRGGYMAFGFLKREE